MRRWRVDSKFAAAAALSALMAACMVPCAVYAQEETAQTEAFEPSEEETGQDVPAHSETEVESTQATYTEVEFPFYFGNMETVLTYPLYFINDAMDLPYINLKDWANIMVQVYGNDQGTYRLEMEFDGPIATLTRENGYSMLIDFDEEKIYFDDFDAFVHDATDYSLIDIISNTFTDDNGNPALIKRVQRGSFDRYGKPVELDLAAYAIRLYTIAEDGLYLVPLQTLSDFLMSYPTGVSFLFNTTAVYVGNKKALGLGSPEQTPLGESYLYSAPSNMLSENLAFYSYCELCLALDNLYGLKDTHDIQNFDDLFAQTGYKTDLLSTDPNVKDGALLDFINYYLDDLHSGYVFSSYLTDEAKSIGGDGLSTLRGMEQGSLYDVARTNADHPIKPYEEVGNTAYITFDTFYLPKPGKEYYTEIPEPGDDPADEALDTAELLLYAHKQITRENSPIENVVIDLSINGGGDADAAAIVAAWYLGEASLSIKSSLTGATSTGTYRFDANLDGEFDEKDTVRDKNLYCLIGPYSFSCGNLIPNIFRASNIVTLLGKTSGGGSCTVLPMSTAHGTMFNISSPKRLSYLKNGAYYNTDTGITPDCVITRISNFYDRQALTDYINNLF